MKAHAFRIPLLLAALSIAAPLLQAAPSLPITEAPVTSLNLDGPPIDPATTNGQWFLDGSLEESRPYEFYDNVQGDGGGDYGSDAIWGIVQNVQLGGAGQPYVDPIIYFEIEATIHNDSAPTYGQESASDNQHSESRPAGTERYSGILLDTKLTAEFAIAETNLVPGIWNPPYILPPYPSWIIADNEDQLGWYCWNQPDPPAVEAGNYYVPTWDFGDIPLNQFATRTLTFKVDPPMYPTDPRYYSIYDAQIEGVDIFVNRTTSLKISTWIDDIGVDFGDSYPQDVARSSMVSVFHNIEPPYDPTHKMHWPQLPDPNGWDVRACNQPDGLEKVLADDFLCTSNGPITKITFWGSFRWDEYLPVTYHDFNGIDNFHLSLHADMPAGLLAPWSMPESPPLWEKNINPLNPPAGWTVTVTPEIPSDQGWHDPNLPQNTEANNHMEYFRYEVTIPTNEAFEQVEGTIYWLDISATTTGPEWGWKTTTNHWNDAAVWADLPVTNQTQWNPLYEPFAYTTNLDLAFVIDGGAPTPQEDYDFGDLPDAYNTLLASGGAYHTLVPGIFLGAGVDGEPDGQPSAAADGDDLFDGNDDEDGITVGTLIAGQVGVLSVNASVPGTLEVWMDVDNSGNWTAGDNILTMTIPAGNTTGNLLPIPASTAPGLNVMRVRFNTLGPIGSPTGGPAVNGEVEDYIVYIEELDWGDAPDAIVPTQYPTLGVNNGARHVILGGGQNPTLGGLVDPEPDGQPMPQADGDDLDILYPSLGDDEDGVTFLTPLVPNTVAQISVTASGATGLLQCWIDSNGNGSWGDPGEQVLTDVPLAIGANLLTFTVPPNGTASFVQAGIRFRYSSASGLAVTGQAPDGEVEDYMEMVYPEVEVDWGDAYDNFQGMVYPTLLIHNGAHHVIVPGMFLGNLVDPEPDGQPNLAANGDDIDLLSPSLGDDEDGVFFTTPLQPGGFAGVDVIASMPGVLDAWVDFNNDGDWADTGEQIFTAQALVSGVNSLVFGVPVTTQQNTPLVSRFRYSSGGVATYTGLAMDGEVEDHLTPAVLPIDPQGVDWGDAMEPPYQTTLLFNGARHSIVPGIMLGAFVDAEPDGQPDPQAMGDDIDLMFPALGDDEDGIFFTSKLVASSNATIDVVAGVGGGWLDAWVDYNGDGTWSHPAEQIFGGSLPLGPGLNAGITFTVPGLPAQALGPSMARFRISSIGGLQPFGPASDGEVEDYYVELFQPIPTNLVITNQTFDATFAVTTNEWTVQNGIIYQMESSTNLVTGPWVPAGSAVTGPANSQTDSISSDDVKFYRVTAPSTP